MLRHRTTVTTRHPVQVRVGVCPAPSAMGTEITAVFEVDGIVVARRTLPTLDAARWWVSVLGEPVVLRLFAAADGAGGVTGALCAQHSAPGVAVGSAWSPAMPPDRWLPLGVVRREPGERLYPTELSTEAKCLLRDLVNAPVVEALEAAVEDLLAGISRTPGGDSGEAGCGPAVG